jgi:hypothetical protein
MHLYFLPLLPEEPAAVAGAGAAAFSCGLAACSSWNFCTHAAMSKLVRCGYKKTLRMDPIAFGGRFFLNLAIMTPFLPCPLVILPQITYRQGSQKYQK